MIPNLYPTPPDENARIDYPSSNPSGFDAVPAREPSYFALPASLQSQSHPPASQSQPHFQPPLSQGLPDNTYQPPTFSSPQQQDSVNGYQPRSELAPSKPSSSSSFVPPPAYQPDRQQPKQPECQIPSYSPPQFQPPPPATAAAGGEEGNYSRSR